VVPHGSVSSDARVKPVYQTLHAAPCLCRARTRTLTLSWYFPRSLGCSPVLADQALDDVGSLDPGGHIDALAGLVGLGAVEQVDGEEVAGQDCLGLRAQESCPGWPGPSWRGVDAVGLEDLPYGRRCDVDSQAGQLAVDPAVSPCAGSAWPVAGPARGSPPGPAGVRWYSDGSTCS
jgi:hypothetical protein